MKIVRRCPRCNAHLYHWVNTPKTDDEKLQGLRFESWPSEKMPSSVQIECASCNHRWQGRLSRDERGLEDAA